MSSVFDFSYLSEKLLRNGLSPKTVSRVVRELRDHSQDLYEAALIYGRDPVHAQNIAYAQLGDEDTIADGLIAKPELRSWTARWPWLFYTLLPIAMMMTAIIVVVALTVGLVKTVEWINPALPGWLSEGISSALIGFSILAPVALTAIMGWFAATRRSSFLWPTIGMVTIALFGGSFDIYMGWGEVGELSSLTVNSTFIWPFPDSLLATLARAAVNLLIVLGPYLYWLRAHQRQTSQT